MVLAALLVTAVGLSPELAAIEERSILLARVRTAMGWAVETKEVGAQDAEAPAPTENAGGADDESSGR